MLLTVNNIDNVAFTTAVPDNRELVRHILSGDYDGRAMKLVRENPALKREYVMAIRDPNVDPLTVKANAMAIAKDSLIRFMQRRQKTEGWSEQGIDTSVMGSGKGLCCL